MSDSDNEFQKGDAGSSLTYPEAAGTVKKNAYCMLKGHPCRVTDVSTSKAGKHGHAKASITGVDIFTNKKYEDQAPTSHNIEIPFVTKKEYGVVDVQEDGFLVLLNEDGTTKEDLKLPVGDQDEAETSANIKQMFADGKDILISVLSSLGKEKVVGVRESQN